MTRFTYYSYDRILSFNATYNLIAGGRGIGKTFGAKKKAIKDAINKGDQFIYLRRYGTELKLARATFFADIEWAFPEWEFRINGFTAEMAPVSTKGEKKREWTIIGYFVALSTAQTQKSVSFPKVKTIIYDEFIIEKGALIYLANEVTVFNNFYLTVDRFLDKTRVFFLANAVTIMNPYFIAWKIEPDNIGSDVIVKEGGFIAAHFPDSDKFASEVYNTSFGKFISGTEYGQYAVGNTFADNHNQLVKGKSSNAKYQFTLETANGSFSVWYDMDSGEFYIQSKLPKNQVLFTLLPERMDKHKILMAVNDKPLANLRGAFRRGRVSFDSPPTRNTFAEVFKR